MKNIFITGLPGAGKTTLLKRLCIIFKEFNPAGFITTEITEDGNKLGYEITNLYGDSRIIAHTKIKSKFVMGKFKIDIKGFEDFLPKTFPKDKKTGLYIIDEIGKMECESKKFSRLLIEMLDSDRPVIATIAEKGTGFIADIKKREDIWIFEVTEHNRDLRLKELTMTVRDLLLE
jgi:nucleoside-triphosphatase